MDLQLQYIMPSFVEFHQKGNNGCIERFLNYLERFLKMSLIYLFLRLRKTQSALQLLIFFFFSFFFFSFFCYPGPVLRNCKLVFLILKISQYGGSRRRVELFPRYSRKN